MVFTRFLLVLLLSVLFVISPETEGKSDKGVAMSIGNEKITIEQVNKSNAQEIYEAEIKLFDLQMDSLRVILIDKMIQLDPRSKGLANVDYLDKYVLYAVPVSDKDVDRLLAQSRVPKDKINANYREQARLFIENQNKARQIDKWLDKQKQKHGVVIHLEEPEEPRFSVGIDGEPYRGGKEAPVTIVEFSDFQCPYCIKVNQTLYELNEHYGDKIKIVYKQFPLSSIHPEAHKAAEASLCAFDQGKDNFWKMHDAMFANQHKLTVGPLKDLAKEIGLEPAQFNECLMSDKYSNRVYDNLREGLQLGINSTPAFFINGKLVKGAIPFNTFKALIDEELGEE